MGHVRRFGGILLLLSVAAGLHGPAAGAKTPNGEPAAQLAPSEDVKIAFVNGNEPQSQAKQQQQTEMSELRASATPVVGHAERAQPSRCPLSADLDRPEPVPELVRCPEYRENACCSQKEDARLDADFIAAYEYIFSGCAGCLENFRLFQCHMRCSPEQADFVTAEPPQVAAAAESEQAAAAAAAAVEGGGWPQLKATVRMCPEFCARFYHSCVNTTSRAVFHADDGTFCASQVDTAAGIEVVIDQFSCINSAGPAYCNGDYIHEAESEDTWTTKQIVKAAIFGAIVFLTLSCGLYYMCTDSKDQDYTIEKEFQPYLRQWLRIPGGDNKE